MTVPQDFLRALKADRVGSAFFQTLNKANTYAIAWRLRTAKSPETRQRRMTKLLAMMHARTRLH